jgi:hypothetical protein
MFLCQLYTLVIAVMIYVILDLPPDRYDLLHNAHLNLEGLDELFKVAQVTDKINFCIHTSLEEFILLMI